MTPDIDGSCQFRLPVPDYEEEFPWLDGHPGWGLGTAEVGSGVEDGVWHCPHDAYGDYDRCPFHLDPDERPSEDVAAHLVETIEAANRHDDPAACRRYCQFVGAKFPRLDLEQQVIGGGSRETIDFRHAEFGVVACRKAQFEQPVDFSGATFDPGVAPAIAPGTEVLDPALSQVAFGIDFTYAAFSDLVDFRSALFRRPALFRETTFERAVRCKRTRFLDHVSFLAADFEDLAMFNDALFRRDARFQACEFVDLADFKRSYCGGRVSFDRAICEGDIELDDANFTAPPPDSPADAGATFRGTVTADMAVVTGRLSFNRITIDDDVRVRDAEVSKLRLESPDIRGETGYIDLDRSTIDRGRLDQPNGDDGEMVYDLYRTTLGDVKFLGNSGDRVPDRIRFFRTQYAGFDFTDEDAIDLTEVDHSIHRFDVDPLSVPCYCGDGPEHCGRYIIDNAVCPRHERKFTHSALQATYAYAKNGADEAGDNASAGAFFYREMCAHRAEYFRNAIHPGSDVGPLGRLREGSKWFRSWLLALSTGYGELPYRVIVTSLAIIGAFGYVYWNVYGLDTGQSLVEALIFSFQSFISFVLGPPESTTLTEEALSAIQGFVGAFLIALFVFTFTRRIHR